MEKRDVALRTNKRRFFRQYLEIVKNFKPYNRLRSKELDVLAELYYFNDKYKDIPSKERWLIIFSYDTRQEIGTYLGDMSTNSFNNILTSLRKNGLLKSNMIPEQYLFTVENNFEINFKFLINAD